MTMVLQASAFLDQGVGMSNGNQRLLFPIHITLFQLAKLGLCIPFSLMHIVLEQKAYL
jgi:hypothetical protein